MKYDIQFTTQFKKDLKLAKKQNKDLDKLFSVIEVLARGKRFHPNTGTMIYPETTRGPGSAMWSRIGC